MRMDILAGSSKRLCSFLLLSQLLQLLHVSSPSRGGGECQVLLGRVMEMEKGLESTAPFAWSASSSGGSSSHFPSSSPSSTSPSSSLPPSSVAPPPTKDPVEVKEEMTKAVASSGIKIMTATGTLPDIFEAENDVAFLVLGTACLNSHVLVFAAQMAGSMGRIHLVTDSQSAMDSAKETAVSQSWGHGLIVADVRGLIHKVEEKFLSVYKHQSVNGYSYEAMCFWRWGLLHHYVDALQSGGITIRRFFVMDADVLATRPYSEWMPRDFAASFGNSTSLVVFLLGAATAWSPQEISNFWFYIMDIYATPESQKTFVLSFGNKIVPTNTSQGRTEIIPRNDTWQYHISDMEAMTAFVLTAPTRRSVIHIDVELPAFEGGERDFQQYKCSHTAVLIKRNNSKVTLLFDNTSLRAKNVYNFKLMTNLFNTSLPLCLVHFQGRGKQHMTRMAQFIEDHKNGSTYTF